MINTRVPSSLLVSRLASDIVQKQNALAAVQEQISSGKMINRPSDAPAESAHLLTMEETLSRLEQYTANSSIAESQLALEEGAIAGTTNALNRIRELAVRANGGLVGDGFRNEIAAEVDLILGELYSQANATDSFGNFLFSGSNAEEQPFKPGTPVNYSGTDDSRQMEIALGRSIHTGDSGADVFMRIRNGNGDFQSSVAQTNTGSGAISKGSVSDSSVFNGGEFDITFTSPTSFDVVDAATGTTVTQTYQPGSDIEAGGMTVRISGEPVAGDTFKLEPSQYQDIFTSVSNLVDTLSGSPQTGSQTAQMAANISISIDDIDNALDHLNTVRSSVGTRLTSIDSSRQENENISLQIERTKRDVEDVDIADAVTRLQEQANSLEILQKSFTRIEGLSLFNFM